MIYLFIYLFIYFFGVQDRASLSWNLSVWSENLNRQLWPGADSCDCCGTDEQIPLWPEATVPPGSNTEVHRTTGVVPDSSCIIKIDLKYLSQMSKPESKSF